MANYNTHMCIESSNSYLYLKHKLLTDKHLRFNLFCCLCGSCYSSKLGIRSHRPYWSIKYNLAWWLAFELWLGLGSNYALNVMKIGYAVIKIWVVEICLLPLLCPLAYTAACINVPAMTTAW